MMHENPDIPLIPVIVLTYGYDRKLLYRLAPYRIDDYQIKPLIAHHGWHSGFSRSLRTDNLSGPPSAVQRSVQRTVRRQSLRRNARKGRSRRVNRSLMYRSYRMSTRRENCHERCKPHE